MAWVNTIEVSGLVGRDAQRNSEKGPWRFCLSQRGGRKKDGSGYWPTEFFDVGTFHDTGGQVKRGQEVTVKGRLRQQSWEDASGEKRNRLCIIAAEVTLPDLPAADGVTHIAEAPPPPAPPIMSRFEIPSHPVRQVKVAAARPVTEQDPITNDDIPW